jgi:ATP adenylyltransferase
MERLFTPWRHAYVTSQERPSGCVLCQALEQVGDADSLVLHVGRSSFVLMNLFPYNAGHLMVAVKRHIPSLTAATEEELAEMMALARRAERVLTEVYRPHGINVGMNLGRTAGAGVAEHIHLHVVPRWDGDTSFMSVVGETRVIPEEPAAACQRLRPRFSR